MRRDATAAYAVVIDTTSLGCFINPFTRQTVHDACVALVFFLDKSKQLLTNLVFFNYPVNDIGAIKTGDEVGRVFKL